MKVMHIKLPVLLSVLVLLVSSLTAGCGYHLRGALVLPDNLKALAIEADIREYELVDALTQTMRNAGVSVVKEATDDVSVLNILGVGDERDTAAIDRSGNVLKYELKYEVSYSVTDSQGNSLIAPATIKVRKTYDYDQANPVQSEREEALVLEQLRQEVASRILRTIGPELARVTKTPTS